MEYEHDLMVYIGRFQPLHNGHINTIRLALKTARRVIILVGSDKAPLTARNPFTCEERQAMIRGSLDPEEYNRCLVAGLEDFTYRDEDWVARVKEIVQGFNAIYGGTGSRIGITGFDRDSSSYYLKMFPDWKTSLKPEIEKISATEIRHCLFDTGAILTDVLPRSVCEFLIQFKGTDRYNDLQEEHVHCKNYKDEAHLRYPFITVAVDSIVTHINHVLLVKRKNHPGKGLWALPGGHIHLDETLQNAAKRELLEETGLNLWDLKHKVSSHTFDDPNRSPRGRIITTGFHFDLNMDGLDRRPEASADDDAVEAKWFHSQFDLHRMRSEITEDHLHIINYFLKGKS